VEAARRGAEAFANSSMHGIFVSASGMWLHDPVAVLKAMSGEQFVSALVALTEPAYDASARTLTFRVRTLSHLSLPLVACSALTGTLRPVCTAPAYGCSQSPARCTKKKKKKKTTSA